MKKKYLFSAVMLMLMLSLCSFAKEKISLPSFDVKINDTAFPSENREYPLIVYNDIIYFPMTYYDARFLGLKTVWNDGTKTLEITKSDATAGYREYKYDGKNPLSDTASVCSFNITVNGKAIDNKSEKYPLLVYRDVTYFPLTWRFAVDEFGWKYSFSQSDGLNITSEGTALRSFTLPKMGKYSAIGADEDYYYYSGDDNKIYRLLKNTDNSTPEAIFSIDVIENDTYYSDGIILPSFEYTKGKVYFTYHTGGATIGSDHRYVINSDGTCKKSNGGTRSFAGIGFNAYQIEADSFTVTRYNDGSKGSTTVYYEFDTDEEMTEISLEGVVLGESFDKESDKISTVEPYILGSKIYLVGYEKTKEKNSSLYVFDTQTKELKKVLDDVQTFFVFSGYDNDMNMMSDMVIFDRSGKRFRYSLLSEKEIIVDTDVRNMTMAVSNGSGEIIVVGDDGKSSEVRFYDGYGSGSVKNVRFESSNAVLYYVKNGTLYAEDRNGEAKLIVFSSEYDIFKTCENAKSVFVSENEVLFVVYEDGKAYVFECKI